MAKTPSTMLLKIGAPAPAFTLPDVHNKQVSLSDFKGKPLVVMFICNHCPFVKHIRAGLAEFGRDYGAKGLNIVAINSNDVEKYPDDNLQAMGREVKSVGYTFPYLLDETQKVAQAYTASCTPDFFVFDKNHALAYCGQFDEARPGNNKPVTGSDLRRAADSVLAGKAPLSQQTPSIGCNIKWKAGNEPAYFPH
jgi:peroxiredoxin